MTFKSDILESERKKHSNIILALDLATEKRDDLVKRSIRILEMVHPYICALKVNHHLVLPLGLFNGVKKIVEKGHSLDLPVIMDCKINDIGNTNQIIAENYFKAGFDSVIANPFVGWEEGLQPVFEVAKKMDKGVILLVYMSHKASWEGYGQEVAEKSIDKTKHQYVIFAEKALAWNADGAIVGATYPDKIKEVHSVLNEKVPIFSPGIGAQGGDIEAAISAGARYLIIGRSIIDASNPEETARNLRDTAARFSSKTQSSRP